jgi:glycosyltransferase involved in cell wall biosynthesis
VRKTAFSGDELRLAFIGRLDMHIKGLDLLVEAVELCRQDMEDAGLRLDIYGPDENGTHKKLTEQIQIRGLQTMIHLHPPVFGQEKRQVLLDADCLVLTSRTEGMPVSALEALSYGLPCLVTEGTGMATRLEESGAGFGCETTAEGISRALVRVAQCKGELRRFSEAALVLARANYDENEIARQTVAAYKQMT